MKQSGAVGPQRVGTAEQGKEGGCAREKEREQFIKVHCSVDMVDVKALHCELVSAGTVQSLHLVDQVGGTANTNDSLTPSASNDSFTSSSYLF